VSPDDERLALSFLARTGDPVLGVRRCAPGRPAELLALVTGADADGEALLAQQSEDAVLNHALPRWWDPAGRDPQHGKTGSLA
jgi:hypothetical protein